MIDTIPNTEEQKPLLSFVIPCYRSEHSIEQITERIIKTVQTDGRYDYEIICVNDCSPDGTYSVLKKIAENNHKITVVDLMRNFGQHSALMAGFHYVRGDTVICLDDDGQTPPEEMFKLIDKLNEGYDLVSASYYVKKESAFRRFGSWTAEKVGEILVNKPKNVDLNSFFAVRRIITDEIIRYQHPYPNVQGLILRVTRSISDVKVEHCERMNGSSGYTLAKLIGLWMNSFTSFSEKPLRISTFLGLIASLGGFIFGIITVVRKLIHPDVMLGYSSIMAVMLFMSGIILLILGLLGEYIGRMFICINCAPQFVIRSVFRQDEKTQSNSHSE